MDRKISSSVLKNERNKKILKYGLIVLVVFVAGAGIKSLISPKLYRENLLIGTVDKGNIILTVSASGKVQALSEEIIVAPITSRIMEVYKQAGDTVNVNDPILRLELSSIETEYKQKIDEREMKKRKLEQTQITLRSSLSELEMQEKIKQMRLKQMHTELKNEKYLDSIGASTTDRVREIEMNYNVSNLELSELQQKIINERAKAEAELKVQELEFQIFEKGLAESARLLNESRILAPQEATLTYINNQIGTQVSVGTQIAILSDLSRFKIEAEISDSYANRLSPGAKAIIKTGQVEYRGTVVNITPSVSNGVVRFSVMLDDNAGTALRSGFNVDVFVEYGVTNNTLRLPNGSYYSTKSEYELWVVKGTEAVKRKVILGESNYDYVEIIDGLQEGDQVILFNMSNYSNKETIKIE